LAERNSWVGVGWSLLVGRVIDDSANGHYYVTLSDGSNHDLTYYGGVAFERLELHDLRSRPAFGTSYLTRGLPSTVRKWHDIAADSSVVSTMKYDECGNVREITDPRAHDLH
jgi:hypothetical protein